MYVTRFMEFLLHGRTVPEKITETTKITIRDIIYNINQWRTARREDVNYQQLKFQDTEQENALLQEDTLQYKKSAYARKCIEILTKINHEGTSAMTRHKF